MVGVISGRYRLTATLPSGATVRSTGSLIIGAPGGIVTDGLPPKVSAPVGAGRDRDAVAGERHMRAPITSGLVAIFVGDHHADLVAAQADPRDLPQGLVPQRARDADRREEIGVPHRLRAGRPGADPVVAIGALLGRQPAPPPGRK